MVRFRPMSSYPGQLHVALRKSALSLCHAQYIRDRLLALYPECEITLRGITTQGDRILEKPLADIGGKGLFIEEIEHGDARGPRRRRRALAQGHADGDDAGLRHRRRSRCARIRATRSSATTTRRSRRCPTAPSSARRACAAKRSCARRIRALNVRLLRGNVNTRVRKLDEGQYDAMILAAAGFNRLEQNHRIAALLDPADFLPAVGQGALAHRVRESTART